MTPDKSYMRRNAELQKCTWYYRLPKTKKGALLQAFPEQGHAEASRKSEEESNQESAPTHRTHAVHVHLIESEPPVSERDAPAPCSLHQQCSTSTGVVQLCPRRRASVTREACPRQGAEVTRGWDPTARDVLVSSFITGTGRLRAPRR